jgi:hypothetical protein
MTTKKPLPGQAMLNGVSVPIHDALAQLNALPNNASLTASEAALFLRSSVTTLERMRKSGIGPAWTANAGAKGSSSVAYVKQALIVWMAANKAGGPVPVAVAVASAAPPPGAGAITLTHEHLNEESIPPTESICKSVIEHIPRYAETNLGDIWVEGEFWDLYDRLLVDGKEDDALKLLTRHLLEIFERKGIISCTISGDRGTVEGRVFKLLWKEDGEDETSTVRYECSDPTAIIDHSKEIDAKKAMLGTDAGVLPGSKKKSLKDRTDIM